MSSKPGSPEYRLSYINDRQTIAVLGGIWHDQRYEWDASNNLIYIGTNELLNESTSTNDYWEITKLTWDASGNLTRMQGPLRGTWDGRAALSW
jgi:YD repeat-containing protein